MKKQWTAIYLLILLTITLQVYGNSSVSDAHPEYRASTLLSSQPNRDGSLVPPGYLHLPQANDLSGEEEVISQPRTHKRYKTKFLRQAVNYRQFFKKSSERLLNCWEETPVEEKEHITPAACNLIRPGYYIFLFRLSPF